MAADYEEKLRAFIADIPPPPGLITSGPPFPPPYTAEFKEKLADPNFPPTNPLFLKYTGTTHHTLVKNWAGGGIMTTCNGLVGLCGAAMGAKHYLGRFDLADFLPTIGKRHAWVTPFAGRRPGYGDLFRPADAYHMGVSLGFDGDDWLTVESGQGGPKSGCDIIRRYRKKFHPVNVEGWCDMWRYLDPRPPVPDWLVGTWAIYCGDAVYSYHFDDRYGASYQLWVSTTGGPPAVPADTGTVTVQGDTVTLTWSKEGGIETFRYDRDGSVPALLEKMTGTSGRGEPLTGVRM